MLAFGIPSEQGMFPPSPGYGPFMVELSAKRKALGKCVTRGLSYLQVTRIRVPNRQGLKHQRALHAH